MDAIQISYDRLDDVPETFRPLYTEKDGKAVLTHVQGLRSQSDIDKLNEALRKERTDHAKTRDTLKPFSGLNPEEIQQKLSRFDELEAAASGKIDDKKIDEIVAQRLNQKISPLQMQLQERDKAIAERDAKLSELQNQIISRKRDDMVRAAANKAKVRPEAISDVELFVERVMQFDETGRLVTKNDIDGILPGLSVDELLKTMSKIRPHWWPESEGGGSRGGSGGFAGKNPWSKDNWNLSEQARVVREEGMDSAQRLARAAGVAVGATGPAK
jgi:hypothetical protein